jgi:acyl dehydratase
MAAIDPTRLAAGDTLPVLAETITPEAIIRYCGAAEDYSRPHWDDRFIRDSGFEGIIVHGWLTMAHLCRAAAQWFPIEAADITGYSVRYHKTVYPALSAMAGRWSGSEQTARSRCLCGRKTWRKR